MAQKVTKNNTEATTSKLVDELLSVINKISSDRRYKI